MKLTEDEKRHIEGYAEGLQHILKSMTGEDGCGKSYDPMTIEGDIMHSYAFNMSDGGRHHLISDYDDADHIKRVMLDETKSRMIEDGVDPNTDKLEKMRNQSFLVTHLSVDESLLRDFLSQLNDAYEYMHEALVDHDSSLGRTTRKNKAHAEIIENDMRKVNKSIEHLKKLNL